MCQLGKHSSSSHSSHFGSGGSTGSRPSSGSGTTIVPSFRFSKADDQMVEVTPTSSFEEIEEPVSHVNIGSVQDIPPMLNHSNNKDSFNRSLINSGPPSTFTYDDIDGFYGAGDSGTGPIQCKLS